MTKVEKIVLVVILVALTLTVIFWNDVKTMVNPNATVLEEKTEKDKKDKDRKKKKEKGEDDDNGKESSQIKQNEAIGLSA